MSTSPVSGDNEMFADNDRVKPVSPVFAINGIQMGNVVEDNVVYDTPKSPTIRLNGIFGDCVNEEVFTPSPNAFNEPSAVTQRLIDSGRVEINAPEGMNEDERPMSPVLLMSYQVPSSDTEENRVNNENCVNSNCDPLESPMDLSVELIEAVEKESVILPNQDLLTSISVNNYEVAFAFQSAGGRRVQPSANSLNRMRAMWNEVLDGSASEINELVLSKKFKTNDVKPSTSNKINNIQALYKSASVCQAEPSASGLNKVKTTSDDVVHLRRNVAVASDTISSLEHQDDSLCKSAPVRNSFDSKLSMSDNEVLIKPAAGRNVKPSIASHPKVNVFGNDVAHENSNMISTPDAVKSNCKFNDEVLHESPIVNAKLNNNGLLSQLNNEMIFLSASGRSVKPSAASLTKVRAMWNDVANECDSIVTPQSMTSNSKHNDEVLQPTLGDTSLSSNGDFSNRNNEVLFKSGTGRTIKPSAASLTKVKAMWNDVINESDNIVGTFGTNNKHNGDALYQPATVNTPNNNCSYSKPNNGVLFQTAAGRSVQPFTASLKKVKGMWNDVVNERDNISTPDAMGLNIEHDKELQPVLINTSENDGNNIIITPDIAKASSKRNDKTFQQLADVKTFANSNSQSAYFNNEAHFTSASGRNVKPSVSSLIKVKAMWNEVVNESNNIINTPSMRLNSDHDEGPALVKIPCNDIGELSNLNDVPHHVNSLRASLLKEETMRNYVVNDSHNTVITPDTLKSCSNPNYDGFHQPSLVKDSKKKTSNGRLSLYELTTEKSTCKVESNRVDDSRIPSPVLDCSFNGDESVVSNDIWNDSFSKPISKSTSADAISSSQNSLEKIKAMFLDEETKDFEIPNYQNKPLNEHPNCMNSSADWEEFPDIRSSQAVLLEKAVHNLSDRKNNGLSSNEIMNFEPTNNFTSKINRDHSTFGAKEVRSSHLNSMDNRINYVTDLITSQKRKSDPLDNAPKKLKTSEDCDIVWESLRKRQEDLISAKRTRTSLGLMTRVKEKSICRYQLQSLGYHLKFADDNCNPEVKQSVISISSENAIHYRFDSSLILSDTIKRYSEGNQIADSCLVVLASNKTAGVEETSKAFLTSPHVNPKHVSTRWIQNHYRWIVWKLASYERNFPRLFDRRCLCLENVLLQLKYRYDREIDLAHRSCFKKILEADASPDKFVCCVASVIRNNLDEGDSSFELELTDGWYSMRTIIDKEMTFLCEKSVVSVGTKLMVYGAEIVNGGQGCDPLDVPPNLRMKISTNSVRRVKWFVKMGFLPNNEPIPTLLCSVLPNGGLIGQMTAVLVRKYPLIYMYKDSEGKTVFRSERSEAAFREQRNKIRAETMEQTYEAILNEVESKYRSMNVDLVKKSLSEGIENITDPKTLFQVISAGDGDYLQSQLTKEQLVAVSNYKEELSSKIKIEVERRLRAKIEEMESKTKVTKLLKARLMDLFTQKDALLTIWRPSEEEFNLIDENQAFEFFNLIASGTRDKVLQLSTHKSTKYVVSSQIKVEPNFQRTLTSIKEIDVQHFSPAFGEIDLVGVVVLVKLPERTKGVTVVVLSDLDGRCISITFWTSLKVFDCEDLMSEGSIISCSNLQWRSVSNQRSMPQVFASERTTFTLNPQLVHLRNGVAEFKNKFKENFAKSVSLAKAQALQALNIKDSSAQSPMAVPKPSNSAISRKPLTPLKDKLKLLNRFSSENIARLSPTPLVVTTRHVFSDFKSPCTPKNSKNSTTYKERTTNRQKNAPL